MTAHKVSEAFDAGPHITADDWTYAKIDGYVVRWPSGSNSMFSNGEPEQVQDLTALPAKVRAALMEK